MADKGFSHRLWHAEKEFAKALRRAEDLSRGSVVHASVRGVFPAMTKNQHFVPIDEGNLRASAYVAWGSSYKTLKKRFQSKRPEKADEMSSEHASRIQTALGRSGQQGGGMFMVEMGYSAYYAIIVHEDLYDGAPRKPHKPFFLTHALNEQRGRIPELIQQYWRSHRKRGKK